MSYVTLVPQDAEGDEHLTLVWMGKGRVGEDSASLKVAINIIACEDVHGLVSGHTVFAGLPVALISLPHRLHVLRYQYLRQYDRSGYEWIPHMTQVKLRTLGEMITFDKIEWRP